MYFLIISSRWLFILYVPDISSPISLLLGAIVPMIKVGIGHDATNRFLMEADATKYKFLDLALLLPWFLPLYRDQTFFLSFSFERDRSEISRETAEHVRIRGCMKEWKPLFLSALQWKALFIDQQFQLAWTLIISAFTVNPKWTA